MSPKSPTLWSSEGFTKNGPNGGSYDIRKNIYFPNGSLFISTPVVFTSGDIGGLQIESYHCYNITNTSFIFIIDLLVDPSTVNNLVYYYLAIGRWK
jgi:hypothetical protein